jgi:hypothetical protein
MPVYETSDGQRFESEEPLTPAEIAELSGDALASSGDAGEQSFGLREAAGAVGMGANQMLAETLGLPMNLYRSLVNLVPGENVIGRVPENLGTETVRSAMQSVGLNPTPAREMPNELKPFGYAGEVLGATAPMMAAPLTASASPAAFARGTLGAQTSRLAAPTESAVAAQAPAAATRLGRAGQAVGRFATNTPRAQGYVSPSIVESAAARPAEVFSAELGGALASAAGAAGAAGAAVQTSPEMAGIAAAGGEIVGAMSPSSLLLRRVPQIARDLRRAYEASGLTKEGRLDAAAREIQSLVEREGGSAEMLARAASRDNPYGLTAGQLTGSPELIALENSLAGESASNAAAFRQTLDRSKALLEEEIDALVRAGDPESLRAAAQARSQYYDDVLNARVLRAQEQIEGATQSIAPSRRPEEASRRAAEIMEEARREAREVESSLWRQYEPRPASVDNVSQAVRDLRAGDPDIAVPGRVRRLLRQAETGSEISSRQLVNIRSELGEAAQSARADGQVNSAQRLEGLRDALLQDLEAAGGPEYGNALAFSRAYNNQFRSENVEPLFRAGRQGETRIPPSEALARTQGRGGERGALEVEAQRRAVEPIETEAVAMLPTQRAADLSAEQEQYLRSMLESTLDPATGQAMPNALARFRRDNRRLLELFPNVNVEDAEEVIRAAQGSLGALERRRAGAARASFARVANVDPEAVPSVFRSALASDRASIEVARLFNAARRPARGGVNQEALEGARSAFLRAAMDRASSGAGVTQGVLNGQQFNETLRRHRRTLLESGAMTEDQYNRLIDMGKEADRVITALRNPDRLEDIVESPSAYSDLVFSALGANLGGMSIMGAATGAPLIMAGRGASALRNIGLGTPIQRVEEVFLEASRNPRLMADLLRRPTSRAAREANMARIRSYALNAGIIDPREIPSEEEREE